MDGAYLDPSDVAGVRRRVVLPVVRSLIREDELDEIQVEIKRAHAHWTAPAGTRGLSVAVRARGEWVHLPRLWSVDDDPAELWDANWFAVEVYDALQDEIAESGFGWGQLRSGNYAVLPGE